MAEKMNYRVVIDGISSGPYTLEQLVGLAGLTPEAFVLPLGAPGKCRWSAARDVPEVAAALAKRWSAECKPSPDGWRDTESAEPSAPPSPPPSPPPESARSLRYWVRVNNGTRGPFRAEELSGMADIGPDTLLCPEGSKGGQDWVRLSDVPGLGRGKEAPSRPPAEPEEPRVGTSEKRYWVRLNNAPKGPFTIDDIAGIVDIGPETLACPEGAKRGDEWRRVCDMPELAQARGLPPPPAKVEPAAKPFPIPPEGRVLPPASGVPEEPKSSFGKATSSFSDLVKLVVAGIAVLGVGGAVVGFLTDSGGGQQAAPTSAQESPGPPLPSIGYDNKWTRQVVKCTDFHWDEYGDLVFKVRLKGKFTDGGSLQYEAYDAQGVVVFSGWVADYSPGRNTKVYEESIVLTKDKMSRVTRIVFGM